MFVGVGPLSKILAVKWAATVDAFVQPGGQTLKLKLNLPIFLFMTNLFYHQLNTFVPLAQTSHLSSGLAELEKKIFLCCLFYLCPRNIDSIP